MTLLDYAVLALVGVGVFFAFRFAKKHRGGCCGNCMECQKYQNCERNIRK